MLTTLFLILLALVLAALAYAATRPNTFAIQRSAVIDAPREKIFPLIDNLAQMNTWNPFLKHDPDCKLVYSGPAAGKGAAHDWEGNRNVGKGRIEITESSAPSRIAMALHMMAPMKARNTVEFTLEPHGDATRVTWAMRGDNTFLSKLMSLCFDSERMVGGAFEKGLADLKAIAER